MVIQRGVVNIDVFNIQTFHKQAAINPKNERLVFI